MSNVSYSVEQLKALHYEIFQKYWLLGVNLPKDMARKRL